MPAFREGLVRLCPCQRCLPLGSKSILYCCFLWKKMSPKERSQRSPWLAGSSPSFAGGGGSGGRKGFPWWPEMPPLAPSHQFPGFSGTRSWHSTHSPTGHPPAIPHLRPSRVGCVLGGWVSALRAVTVPHICYPANFRVLLPSHQLTLHHPSSCRNPAWTSPLRYGGARLLLRPRLRQSWYGESSPVAGGIWGWTWPCLRAACRWEGA